MPNTTSLIAYVDETSRNDAQHGQFYALVATVINVADPDYSALMRHMYTVAHRQRTGTIHASQMRSPEGLKDLTSLENDMGTNPAVMSIAVVRASYGPGGEEEARQRCVAHLLVSLASTYGVVSVTLDSRDALGNATKSMTARKGGRNIIDLRTVEDLKAVGELPETLKVYHANDKNVHQLWLPDIAAYAIGRCLADKDPARIRWVAPRLDMKEALLLPVGERTKVGQKFTSPTELTSDLQSYLYRAKAFQATSGVGREPEEIS